eukprot:GILI01011784.1.p1 GENE.GILI01011784.1~~GILI01011784.1.p1  ORF type:complete len:109 (-),score=30.47 GILI01011784.1:204-530(-)
MSKRQPLMRGTGAKAPPPANRNVGASSFTDGGVAQHALQDHADQPVAKSPNPADASVYDKVEGSSTLEKLYRRKEDEDTERVPFAEERFKPHANKDEILRKIAAIAAK